MSLVVKIARQRLTRSTEVGIVADDTLVANTLDVCLHRLILAKHTIAIDAVVDDGGQSTCKSSRFIDLSKVVTRMSGTGILHTDSAVVKVWARKALVTHAANGLSTSQLRP